MPSHKPTTHIQRLNPMERAGQEFHRDSANPIFGAIPAHLALAPGEKKVSGTHSTVDSLEDQVVLAVRNRFPLHQRRQWPPWKLVRRM